MQRRKFKFKVVRVPDFNLAEREIQCMECGRVHYISKYNKDRIERGQSAQYNCPCGTKIKLKLNQPYGTPKIT